MIVHQRAVFYCTQVWEPCYNVTDKVSVIFIYQTFCISVFFLPIGCFLCPRITGGFSNNDNCSTIVQLDSALTGSSRLDVFVTEITTEYNRGSQTLRNKELE